MAKQPRRESKTKAGGGKSQRRSAVTLANVERRAATRLARLQRAAQRRLAPSTARTAPERRAQDASRQNSIDRIAAKARARQRKRNFKSHRGEPSPTERGEIQFGPQAKGYHVHQRNNHLARALTPEEFQAHEKGKPKVAAISKRDREDLALMHHAATGGDLEA